MKMIFYQQIWEDNKDIKVRISANYHKRICREKYIDIKTTKMLHTIEKPLIKNLAL